MLECAARSISSRQQKGMFRMKRENVFGSLHFCRNLALAFACVAAGIAPAVWGSFTADSVAAQAAAPAQDIVGTWQGTVHPAGAPRDLRMVVKIAKAADGSYKAALYNADQPSPPLAFNTTTLQGSDVKMTTPVLTITGKLSADGKTIDGSVTLGPNPTPVTFAFATPETAWVIPEPLKPMDPNAKPEFDVVTIKPSPPDQRGKGFTMRGTHIVTRNTDLNDLIAFAYGLHSKQIIGAPDWFDKDLFDVDGVPNAEGRPNIPQMKMMIEKMLENRCQLKFHMEQRELSVYILTVAPGGPKLTKSGAAETDPPGFGFRSLGDLAVRNMSMKDFASWMQNGVMDRPVVDQTGVTGRFDFTLKWTPDDSQFVQFRSAGVTPPAPSDDPKAPPSLYTAMPEQIGLKISPGKASDDVMVIDHVEKPSAN